MSNVLHRTHALIAMAAVGATLGLAACSKTAPGVPTGGATPTVPGLPGMPTVPGTPGSAPNLTNASSSPVATSPADLPTTLTGPLTAQDFGGIEVPPGSTLKASPTRFNGMLIAYYSTTNSEAAFYALKASAEQNGFTVSENSEFDKDKNGGSIFATKGKAKFGAIFTSSQDFSLDYTEN